MTLMSKQNHSPQKYIKFVKNHIYDIKLQKIDHLEKDTNIFRSVWLCPDLERYLFISSADIFFIYLMTEISLFPFE